MSDLFSNASKSIGIGVVEVVGHPVNSVVALTGGPFLIVICGGGGGPPLDSLTLFVVTLLSTFF